MHCVSCAISLEWCNTSNSNKIEIETEIVFFKKQLTNIQCCVQGCRIHGNLDCTTEGGVMQLRVRDLLGLVFRNGDPKQYQAMCTVVLFVSRILFVFCCFFHHDNQEKDGF